MQDAAKRLTQYSMYGSKPHTKISTKIKRGFLDVAKDVESKKTSARHK